GMLAVVAAVGWAVGHVRAPVQPCSAPVPVEASLPGGNPATTDASSDPPAPPPDPGGSAGQDERGRPPRANSRAATPRQPPVLACAAPKAGPGNPDRLEGVKETAGGLGVLAILGEQDHQEVQPLVNQGEPAATTALGLENSGLELAPRMAGHWHVLLPDQFPT